MPSELGMSGALCREIWRQRAEMMSLRKREEQGLILSYTVGKAWQAVTINCAVSRIKRSASGQ